jgi:hypothetical protein
MVVAERGGVLVARPARVLILDVHANVATQWRLGKR